MRISSEASPGEGRVGVTKSTSGGVAKKYRRGRAAPVLLELGLLALTMPAFVTVLALAHLPLGDILRVAGLWSLVQLGLLALMAHRHLREWSDATSQMADALALGRRAELAEAAVRREEERLHELRATVVGLGLTRRLLHERRTDLPPPARTRLEGLYEWELSRLERLVGEPDHEVPEPVDVASLVEPLVDSLRLRGIDVVWRPAPAWVTACPDQVVEIVHNLLENAARHGGGAGVTVRCSTVGSEVRVTVSDDGPGVPAAMVPQLFARGTRRSGSPGQGLGLHIARRLAREMGGELGIESGPQRSGVGFVLTLPAAVEDAPCLAAAR